MEHHRLLDEELPLSPTTSEGPRAAAAHEPSTSTRATYDPSFHIFRSTQCLFILRFCTEFSVALLQLPFVRLVEHAVCTRHLSIHRNGLEEERCKSSVIQNKVATIIGFKLAFDAMPCILTALLYGSLANSHGRNFVMILSITGQLLAFVWMIFVGFHPGNMPVELLWLSSALLLIGGGIRLELSMQYTSFCDAVSWKSRTALLSYLHAAASVAAVLGYPIGSVLMEYRLWAPYSVAAAIFPLKYAVLWYTPETSPNLTDDSAQRSLPPESSAPTSDGSLRSPHVRTTTSRNAGPKRLYAITILRDQISSVWDFFQHRGLIVIFGCYFTKRIAFASESFASQYASESLQITLFETFWIRYSNHMGMLLVLSILLPLLTRNLPSPGKEVWVLKASLLTLCTGFLIFWLGRSLVVFCIGLAVCGMGEGLEIGLQSLGSHIVGNQKHATFFAFVSMLGVAGELMGGPLMAQTYKIRSEMDQPLGYCFLLSMILFGCLFFSSFLMRTSKL